MKETTWKQTHIRYEDLVDRILEIEGNISIEATKALKWFVSNYGNEFHKIEKIKENLRKGCEVQQIWLRWLNDNWKTNLVEVDSSKIYIIKYLNNLFKLHKIKEHYSFISLQDSYSNLNGIFNSIEEAIRHCLDKEYIIQEFDTYREFVRYLNKVK